MPKLYICDVTFKYVHLSSQRAYSVTTFGLFVYTIHSIICLKIIINDRCLALRDTQSYSTQLWLSRV